MKNFLLGIFLVATMFSAANATDVTKTSRVVSVSTVTNVASVAYLTNFYCLDLGDGLVQVTVFCSDGRSCVFNLKIQGNYHDPNNVTNQARIAANRFCESGRPCIVGTTQPFSKGVEAQKDTMK